MLKKVGNPIENPFNWQNYPDPMYCIGDRLTPCAKSATPTHENDRVKKKWKIFSLENKCKDQAEVGE